MKRGDIVIAVISGDYGKPRLSCNPISLIPHMQVLRFAPSPPTWLTHLSFG